MAGDRTSGSAGPGRRLGALVIDVLLVVVGGLVIGALVGGVRGLAGTPAQSYGPAWSVLSVLAAALVTALLTVPVFALLYGLLEVIARASAGKMILGMIIAGAAGARCSRGRLLLRYVLKYGFLIFPVLASLMDVISYSTLGPAARVMRWLTLPGVVIVFGGLAALGPGSRALHDMIAGTAVFRRRAGG